MQPGKWAPPNSAVGGNDGTTVLSILRDTDDNGNPVMVSCWYPSEKDIRAMIDGRPLLLWVSGTVHPPVTISVQENNGIDNT